MCFAFITHNEKHLVTDAKQAINNMYLLHLMSLVHTDEMHQIYTFISHTWFSSIGPFFPELAQVRQKSNSELFRIIMAELIQATY